MKRAFTLLEILIVVAIIALLAAIIFPVFARAREKSRQAVCVSNLKQLGSSMAMYIQDFERYPRALDPSDKFTPQIWAGHPEYQAMIDSMPLLTDAMDPYVKSAGLWKCPSDFGFDRIESNDVELDARPSAFEKYGMSYFYRTELTFLNLADDFLKAPAETNVLFDAHGDWHASGILTRGDKRYSVLFADGHAKNINRDAFEKAWDTDVQ